MEDNDKNPRNQPMTDAEIVATTVGDRTPHNGPIQLDQYNPAWPAQFVEIARKIQGALGAELLQIEHVGSTSIPGLSAKPVIDVLLVVTDSAVEEHYVPQLDRVGFSLRIREPDWFEHRLLKPETADANIHVFSTGCIEIDRMLAFRNRLRANESDRMLYQATKTRLAAKTWQYTQNYADAKSEIVEQILSTFIERR